RIKGFKNVFALRRIYTFSPVDYTDIRLLVLLFNSRFQFNAALAGGEFAVALTIFAQIAQYLMQLAWIELGYYRIYQQFQFQWGPVAAFGGVVPNEIWQPWVQLHLLGWGGTSPRQLQDM